MPRGGLHLYFRHRPGFGNTTDRLDPHVETGGDGWQVVFVGSAIDGKRQALTRRVRLYRCLYWIPAMRIQMRRKLAQAAMRVSRAGLL